MKCFQHKYSGGAKAAPKKDPVGDDLEARRRLWESQVPSIIIYAGSLIIHVTNHPMTNHLCQITNHLNYFSFY